jgi:hypothetical protein
VRQRVGKFEEYIYSALRTGFSNLFIPKKTKKKKTASHDNKVVLLPNPQRIHRIFFCLCKKARNIPVHIFSKLGEVRSLCAARRKVDARGPQDVSEPGQRYCFFNPFFSWRCCSI